ncbi:MAG: hypothetical protein HY257_07460 [Chloroflexi bacterium]|nr:hypothetical protein [Chloroflexota bacterium]
MSAENKSAPANPFARLRTRAREYFLLARRFSKRYGPVLLALIASALIGWSFANGVSDYTNGGWEIHFNQRALGINIHFHHWYYGIPLYILAILLIELNDLISVFFFGLGQALAAHSFVNERGIPSLIEGAPVLPLPPEIYFPIATILALLYAFFVMRREEWLARAREREEIGTSYFCAKNNLDSVLAMVDQWAADKFSHSKRHRDGDTQIVYGEWRALDKQEKGEWQLHYIASPFDAQLMLVNIRMQHIPLQGRAGQLDEWIVELHNLLKTDAYLTIAGPQRAEMRLAAKD